MTALTHAEMLAMIEAAPEGAAHVPAGSADEDGQHNARVLDDLFAEGWVRTDFPPTKNAAGEYFAVVGLRLTDRGRRELRQRENDDEMPATAVQMIAIERLLTELRRVDESLQLDRDQRAVFDAERATLEAQQRSPRPNRAVIRAALRGLLWVAKAAGEGLVGIAVAEALAAMAAG